METADGQKPKGCREDMDISKDVQNLESICDDIKDLGVKYLTVYAFLQKTGSVPEKKSKV